MLKPAFTEGVGTSVYADAGNTSVYADQPQTSVYADLLHTSVYADQPHTSVYADPHTSVYADQPHTIKEMAKDPIQDAIFNPGVPVEQFAEAAPGAQAEAAAALKPVFAEPAFGVFAAQVGDVFHGAAEAGGTYDGAVSAGQTALRHVVPPGMLVVTVEQIFDSERVQAAAHVEIGRA